MGFLWFCTLCHVRNYGIITTYLQTERSHWVNALPCFFLSLFFLMTTKNAACLSVCQCDYRHYRCMMEVYSVSDNMLWKTGDPNAWSQTSKERREQISRVSVVGISKVRLEKLHSLGKDKFINFIRSINFARHFYCACWKFHEMFFGFAYKPRWCLVLKSRSLFLGENDCIVIRGVFTADIQIHPRYICIICSVSIFLFFLFLAALLPASGDESGDVCRSGHVSVPAVNIAED